MRILFLVLNVFAFEILNYDILSFQNEGPYEYFDFIFNVGKEIPNAAKSGESDCSVMNKNLSVCYGQSSMTSYSALANGTDGVLVTIEGPESRVAFIEIVCSSSSSIDQSNYGAETYNVIFFSPYGCAGSGPGLMCSAREPIKTAAYPCGSITCNLQSDGTCAEGCREFNIVDARGECIFIGNPGTLKGSGLVTVKTLVIVIVTAVVGSLILNVLATVIIVKLLQTHQRKADYTAIQG